MSPKKFFIILGVFITLTAVSLILHWQNPIPWAEALLLVAVVAGIIWFFTWSRFAWYYNVSIALLLAIGICLWVGFTAYFNPRYYGELHYASADSTKSGDTETQPKGDTIPKPGVNLSQYDSIKYARKAIVKQEKDYNDSLQKAIAAIRAKLKQDSIDKAVYGQQMCTIKKERKKFAEEIALLNKKRDALASTPLNDCGSCAVEQSKPPIKPRSADIHKGGKKVKQAILDKTATSAKPGKGKMSVGQFLGKN